MNRYAKACPLCGMPYDGLRDGGPMCEHTPYVLLLATPMGCAYEVDISPDGDDEDAVPIFVPTTATPLPEVGT